jgi:hypothetical protein
MKIDRIIWGVVFLFIGTVLLLQNLNVIEFYWRNTFSFWPILLLVGGLKMLFNRGEKRTGSYLALGLVIVSLGFLFYRGQQVPDDNAFSSIFHFEDGNDDDIDWSDDQSDANGKSKVILYNEGFNVADSAKKTVLNLAGGGVSFAIDYATDSLFQAEVKKRKSNFSLTRINTDTSTTLNFDVNKSKNRRGNHWSINASGSKVNIKLNPIVQWDMNLNMGASEVDFDLSAFKIRNFTFDGGASDVELKFGDKLPISDVKIKTGAANIEIKVPLNSGCRISTNSGLTTTDFKGFSKTNEGYYETANYKTAKNKIIIDLQGGLSNFEVDRY